MKQQDYLNGWWCLLPNICLLSAIVGQFNPTYLPSLTWGRSSLAPQVIDWKVQKIPLKLPSLPILALSN